MAKSSRHLSVAERIDAFCDQFEKDFRSGRKPVLETCLSKATDTARPALFRALLELEVELRQKAGETPKVADYESRFPDQAQVIQAVFEALRTARSNQSSVRATGIDTSHSQVSHSQVLKVKTPAPPGKPVPSVLGRFEIKSVLGEGAFGTVYRARDPQLDRDVALKVPKFAGQQSLEDRERFLREARAAAGLHHAQICPVHEIGTIDGVDYIVLAFIDGKPLSRILQTQPKLSNRQIVTVIRKLALALQEAHNQGIIHRDLKPGNIMINRKGEPVIMDFGLARRSHSTDAQISHSGQIMGTPAYMSPEQARGDGKTVGPATDIYSLGIVLYEMICGRRPFEGTVTEVIGKILHTDAPPPAQFRPDVDQRLQAICVKAIAKKPDDRFASMTEFSTALVDYARVIPTGDRPVTAPSIETGKEAPTNQFADLLAAISSDVESKVERAVRRVERPHRMPWWSYLAGSALMGLIVLLGILFFIRKDTVTVIVSIPIENINDPALSFILDNNPIAATAFAAPIELKPGQHELVVNKDGQLFKRFVFDVGAKQTDPVVVQDVTPEPSPTPEMVLERLQGRWIAVAQARSGAQLSPEELQAENKVMTITGDQFSIEYQLPKDRNIRGKEAGRIIRVNPSAVPAEIDMVMVFERGNNEPLPFKGIYELQGDRLVHCYRKCHEKNDRPNDFTTVKGEAIFMVEYQRAPEVTDGFVSLFNGKDLTGWTPESGDIENWKVHDGAIAGIADEGVPRPGAETWLLSDQEYQDFLLRFEFRAASETVNSGFGYRAVPREKPPVGTETYAVPSHLQVELFENSANRATGTLATGTLIGSLEPLLSLPANSRGAQKRNEWNRMEVEARGQSIRIHLNGAELLNDSLDDLIARGATYPGLKRQSGRIAFQRLRGTIQFRDIQIKEQNSGDNNDLSQMQGDWDIVSEEFNGVETKSAEIQASRKTLRVSGNQFVISRVFTDGTTGAFTGTIQLNQQAKPRQFDWTGTEPGGTPTDMLGLYALTKDTLKIVYNFPQGITAKPPFGQGHPGKPRPTAFATSGPGAGTVVSTFRRRSAENMAADDGWIDLFNGKDLTGWKVHLNDGTQPPTPWAFDADRKVVIARALGQPGGHSWLETVQSYENYELSLEWRFPPGASVGVNGSGVVILANGLNAINFDPKGVEIDLRRTRDQKLGIGNGCILTYDSVLQSDHKTTSAVGNGNIDTLKEPTVHLDGQWNSTLISCRQGRIQVSLNQELVNEATTTIASGKICLRNQNTDVEFRNIRIRPILVTANAPAGTQAFNGK